MFIMLDITMKNNSEDGFYVGIRYNLDTMGRLERFMKEIGVPSPVNKGALHSTVVQSSHNPGIEFGSRQISEPVSATNLDVFTSVTGARVLVLVLDAQWMSSRHQQLVDLGAKTPPYPFTPHITLSYDIGSWHPPASIPLLSLTPKLEYITKFKDDWLKR